MVEVTEDPGGMDLEITNITDFYLTEESNNKQWVSLFHILYGLYPNFICIEYEVPPL